VFGNNTIGIKLKLKNSLTIVIFLRERGTISQVLLTFKAANSLEVACCLDTNLITLK